MDNTTELGLPDPPFTFMTIVREFLNYFISYVQAVVIICGILGNMISIVIFVRRRKQDSVSAQYLGLLAVTDLANLSFCGVTVWVYANLGFVTGGRYVVNKMMPTDLGCKIIGSYWVIVVFFSAWIIICFSIERALIIWFPLKMGPVFASSKPRRIALISLFAFALCLCNFLARNNQLKPTNPEKEFPQSCITRNDLPYWEIMLGTSLTFGFMNILPILLIIVLNILILVGIFRNRMTDSKSVSNKKNEMRCVKNLLVISTLYVIFISPFVIMYFLYQSLSNTGFKGYSDQAAKDFSQLFVAADALQYFNYSCNPFCYTLSLDYYRAEVKRIFCFWCAKEDPKQKAIRT